MLNAFSFLIINSILNIDAPKCSGNFSAFESDIKIRWCHWLKVGI